MASSSRITRIGGLCVKYFRRHKHAKRYPRELRLAREVVGSRLLKSNHLDVPQPIWASRKAMTMIRRWCKGTHPDPSQGLTSSEVSALAQWLCDNRGKGQDVRLPGGNREALRPRLARLDSARLEPTYIDLIVGGCDLLHGDLVRRNLVRTERGLAVIDCEAVSVGHVVWDAAHVLAFLLHGKAGLAATLIAQIELSREEQVLAHRLALALRRG